MCLTSQPISDIDLDVSRLKACGIEGSLQYLPVYLLQVPSSGTEPDIWMLEACIKGGYMRYSNNAGYTTPELDAELAFAFSHWTFQSTHGRLMVVDLQGVNDGHSFTMTDPAIHCPQDLMRFGDTNFGKHGIELFFGSHTCGPTCVALGLEPVQSSTKPGEPAEQVSLASSLNDWIVFDG